MLPIIITFDLDYLIAANQDEHIELRIKAAVRLNNVDRLRLQKLFLGQLPGRLDRRTLDTIFLLGKIGDKEAIKKLQDLQEVPENIPGKINVAIDESIDNIKKRLLKISD